MTKYIILDRDGVLNFDSDAYIKSPAEWQPIPGSLDAIAKLNQAGYHIAIATNQAGVAKGLYSLETLDRIHAKMQQLLREHGAQVDAIFFCPHQDSDRCECRKPKPGLLKQALKHFSIAPDGIFFVGDKKADVDAARAAGCSPALLRTGYGTDTLKQYPQLDVPVFDDLAAFVAHILEN